MPLNLNKVEKLLYENKFIITSFFIQDGKCKFLRIFSIEHADTLIIYIEDEYDFTINESDISSRNIDIFTLKPITVKEDDNTLDKYKEAPDIKDVEDKYKDTVKLSHTLDENLEEEMENNYKKKILLNDFERTERIKIKDCISQLKRLNMCTQDLKYRLCIVYDNYLCIVENEDIKCYYLKNQKTDGNKIFFVVVELPIFYDKVKNIITDINVIKSGIYKVLDNNQQNHFENLISLLNKFENIHELFNSVIDKKSHYIQRIDHYKNLLENVIEHENNLKNKMSGIEEDFSNKIFNETSYVHQKSKIEAQISDSMKLKQKILNNITNDRQLCDSIYLKTDKSEFDGTIMMDALLKNLVELQKII